MTTVRLNPDELKPEAEETVAGAAPVVLSLSAYDIPQSVSVKRDAEGPLEIRFEYRDKEEDDVRRVNPSVSVILGKHSGKVLGFTVSGSVARKEITIRVVEGVDAQMKLATRDNQRLNYRVIRRVVANRLEPLLAGT